MSVALTQNAITSNRGGMSILNGMTTGELQSIADAILNSSTTPAPAPIADGTALYAANCAGCHGALASSTKKGMTIVRLQNAISGNVGGMGFLSSLSSTEQQALVETLNPPAPAPTPTPVPATPDGAALYAANCAGCHGTLANSTKQGITIARLQNAVNSNIGNMGYLSTLSVSEVQAIVTVLTPSTPTPTPAPTPSPVLDGQALYAANCASCHGALASSAKAGATATRIQTAITNNVGNMGYLSTLSTAQVAAVATSLAAVAPSPAPAPACGSCHAIPPASGKHAKHKSKGISCASCHGSGYTETSFNATTHNNGVKNIDAASTKWNASTRSCANSCHGNKTW
jgi:mono/diheme cytochrome c family protein